MNWSTRKGESPVALYGYREVTPAGMITWSCTQTESKPRRSASSATARQPSMPGSSPKVPKLPVSTPNFIASTPSEPGVAPSPPEPLSRLRGRGGEPSSGAGGSYDDLGGHELTEALEVHAQPFDEDLPVVLAEKRG